MVAPRVTSRSGEVGAGPRRYPTTWRGAALARLDALDQLAAEPGGVGRRERERHVGRHDQRDLVEVAGRHEVAHEPHDPGAPDADVKARPVEPSDPHRLAQPLAGEDAVHAVVGDQLAAAQPVDGQAGRLEAVAHQKVADRQDEDEDRQRAADEADEQAEEHREADPAGESRRIRWQARRAPEEGPRQGPAGRLASSSDATSCRALVPALIRVTAPPRRAGRPTREGSGRDYPAVSAGRQE